MFLYAPRLCYRGEWCGGEEVGGDVEGWGRRRVVMWRGGRGGGGGNVEGWERRRNKRVVRR